MYYYIIYIIYIAFAYIFYHGYCVLDCNAGTYHLLNSSISHRQPHTLTLSPSASYCHLQPHTLTLPKQFWHQNTVTKTNLSRQTYYGQTKMLKPCKLLWIQNEAEYWETGCFIWCFMELFPKLLSVGAWCLNQCWLDSWPNSQPGAKKAFKQDFEIGNNMSFAFISEQTCVPFIGLVYVCYGEIVSISLGGSTQGLGIVRLNP